ncbi:MAG TPA: hypothetical protein VN937_17530 [Blastocatellia bacterium]|nr:hypothetical protein [Blastocatellia bacterium]
MSDKWPALISPLLSRRGYTSDNISVELDSISMPVFFSRSPIKDVRGYRAAGAVCHHFFLRPDEIISREESLMDAT